MPLRHTFIADCETPVSAYLKLRGDGPSFLLESAEQGQRVGRWSFLGFHPAQRDRLGRGRPPRTPTVPCARSSSATASRRSRACRRSRAARSGMFGYDLVRSARADASASRTRTRPAFRISR